MKAQIQLGESTAVVMVILILIVVGLFIAYQFWSADQQTVIEEQKDLDAIALATKVSYLPEIHCTFLGDTSSNCFDKYKLVYFANLMSNPQETSYYYDLFGYARIELIEVYPTNTTYLLYENNKATIQSEKPIYMPCKVYDVYDDSYSFAYIKVTKIS